MAHLIDKDALVAEIENISDYAKEHWAVGYTGAICFANKLKDAINTLELKEVGLEKEYKVFVEEDPVYNKLVNGIVGKAIAKHFFELGLKGKQS